MTSIRFKCINEECDGTIVADIAEHDGLDYGSCNTCNWKVAFNCEIIIDGLHRVPHEVE